MKKLGKHGSTVAGPLLASLGFIIVYLSERTKPGDDPQASSTILRGPFVYILGIMVTVLGNATTQSSLTSLIARYASQQSQAGQQGKYQAVQAMTGFCAPLVGGLLLDSKAWEATPAISAGLYFIFAILARCVIRMNHDLHQLEAHDGETYPHHSWFQLVPGVKNPITKLHEHTFKLFHSSGATHPTAMAVN